MDRESCVLDKKRKILNLLWGMGFFSVLTGICVAVALYFFIHVMLAHIGLGSLIWLVL